MNFAHLHLALNHVPVVGIPLAIVFLVYGLWTNNLKTQRFSLFILCIVAAFVVPVYFSGEPAEEVVEHMPGVTEAFIKPHEEGAETSLIFTVLTGIAALSAIWFQGREKWGRKLTQIVAVLASITFVSLLYTANMGGKIRHTELRDATAGGVTSLQQGDNDEDEKAADGDNREESSEEE
jgi:TRAP-type uncharacterized transport system fused permease subunit